MPEMTADEFRKKILPKYVQEVKNKNNADLQRWQEVTELLKELRGKIYIAIEYYYGLRERYESLAKEKKRLDRIMRELNDEKN